MKLFVQGVVLGFNRFETTTKLCLESLRQQLPKQGFSIKVVDNGSTDGSSSVQKQYLNSTQCFESQYNDFNLGFTGGMNVAFLGSNAEWYLLIGSDTVFPVDALDRLERVLHGVDENVGIVAPVTNNAGTAQRISINKGLTPSAVLELATEQILEDCGLTAALYRADFFCVCIRASVWKKLNGLDSAYGRGYYEDFDFCLRARQIGVEILLAEDLFVYHQGSMSFRGDNEQRKLIRRNKEKLLKRFPRAELRHVRDDCLALLAQYYEKHKSKEFSMREKKRVVLRLRGLDSDLPRSLLKRFLWRKACKELIRKWGGVNVTF